MTPGDPSNLWQSADEESYYVSITDLLLGLLFLFLIMLMYFAIQLRETTETLVTAEQTRSQLLEEIAGDLRARNVRAEVDLGAGVLRLPDEVLFQKGLDTPRDTGREALRQLAEVLSQRVPCYAHDASGVRPERCAPNPHSVEAIFIEGHTDSDPISSNGRIRDNWDLSAARAANTYRLLRDFHPDLEALQSRVASDPRAAPLFSVAGYADRRPVQEGDDEAAKARNRRIDLRFVMAEPEIDAPTPLSGAE
ncbi:OmpA family protein [bacterium]|nr:OmpA family protein [bacterium]